MESVSVHCVVTTAAGRELVEQLREHERLSVSVRERADPSADADVAVVEHAPPDVDAVATVESVAGHDARQPVVVFAPEGSERLAGRAVRAGAADFWVPADTSAAPVAEWLREHAERSGNHAVAHTERERRLEALLAAGDELHDVDTVDQVCATVVETAERILDLPLTGVWMRADDEAVLEPVAVSERSRELVDSPTFRPGESLAWTVHESGETRWYDRVDEQPGIHNEGTVIRSEMLVAIGDRGVLLSGSLTPGAFDAADVRLVELLAASAEAAIRRTERERELERQNERLDRFVGIVSHDLRNPLAVAKANLDAEAESDDDRIAAVEEALDRMERLLDDLRRLAREGESVTAAQRVRLSEVAEAAWSTADVGDARLDVDAGDATVSADPGRLRQLLENLLHNAARHAGNGGPASVTVGTFDGGFFVADDGPGIPPERRETVFDLGFTTAEDGTGFGLAIVREIAGAHGWTVTVGESAAGGARIEVRT